jgi:mono/diheme cytochrome c family protein
MLKKILIGLFILLLVTQFFRPERNVATAKSDKDITTVFAVPDSVQKIFEKACNDCHSNNTRYPWYANIQPVGWWLAHHINEGKHHLNFSEYASYPQKRQVRKLKQIMDQIDEGEMPMDSYLWIHKDAKLTEAEKATVMNWGNPIYAAMPDSLKKKKKDH